MGEENGPAFLAPIAEAGTITALSPDPVDPHYTFSEKTVSSTILRVGVFRAGKCG